jgi:hypothetical protein
MKNFLFGNTMLKVVTLILISTLLVSCNSESQASPQDELNQTSSAQDINSKTKASTQNDSDQSTIFQELGGKTEAETHSNPNQLAIPQEFVGAWQLIDSNAEKHETFGFAGISSLGITQGIVEIVADGTAIHFKKSGNEVVVSKLMILNRDILVFQTDNGGVFLYYELDGDQLKLSFGDEYNLYSRMSSN